VSPISDPESDPRSSSGAKRTEEGREPSRSRPASGRRTRVGDAAGDPGVPPEDEPPVESGGFFPELLRRGLTLGFTGVFMTEEAVRRALADSVPRDLVEFVVAQSDRTRAELLERLSREFGRVLSSLDPAEVARRLLEGRTIEVEARFRLVPDPRKEAADAAAQAAEAEANLKARSHERGDVHDDEHDDEQDEDGGGSRRPREPR